jgi:hypothetical protein
MRELILVDVRVCYTSTGEHLYNLKRAYLGLPLETVIIEAPLSNTYGQENSDTIEEGQQESQASASSAATETESAKTNEA